MSLEASEIAKADILSENISNVTLDENISSEQVVTPWKVEGEVGEDGEKKGIDYDKLINQFGTRKIDENILERFTKLTGGYKTFSMCL
ncbi:tryptophan--tRNA ligase, partial [Massospora cicadina]